MRAVCEFGRGSVGDGKFKDACTGKEDAASLLTWVGLAMRGKREARAVHRMREGLSYYSLGTKGD